MSPISFNVNPEYAQITEIVRGLFICGVSSLTAENMIKYNISFIVNATNEVIVCLILFYFCYDFVILNYR